MFGFYGKQSNGLGSLTKLSRTKEWLKEDASKNEMMKKLFEKGFAFFSNSYLDPNSCSLKRTLLSNIPECNSCL